MRKKCLTSSKCSKLMFPSFSGQDKSSELLTHLLRLLPAYGDLLIRDAILVIRAGPKCILHAVFFALPRLTNLGINLLIIHNQYIFQTKMSGDVLVSVLLMVLQNRILES